MNGTDRAALRDILSVQSVSQDSGAMLEHMVFALAAEGCRVSVDDGMVFAKRGDLREPVPCYVAHLDTVHAIVDPARYKADAWVRKDGELVWHAFDPKTGKQRGIGGDDKCGLFLCLMAARYLPNVQIVLTRDEEIGALGAHALSPEVFAAAACVIQADRRGNDEAIINGAYDDIASGDWQAAMRPILDRHGYSWSHAGTWTDVVALADAGTISVSAVNLAAGYHRAHSEDTYIVESELDRCVTLALEMGERSAGKRWRHTMAPRPAYRDSWEFDDDDLGYAPRRNETAVWLSKTTPTPCDTCGSQADIRVRRGQHCLGCWQAIYDATGDGLSWDNAATVLHEAHMHTRETEQRNAAANVAPTKPRTRKKKAATAPLTLDSLT